MRRFSGGGMVARRPGKPPNPETGSGPAPCVRAARAAALVVPGQGGGVRGHGRRGGQGGRPRTDTSRLRTPSKSRVSTPGGAAVRSYGPDCSSRLRSYAHDPARDRHPWGARNCSARGGRRPALRTDGAGALRSRGHRGRLGFGQQLDERCPGAGHARADRSDGAATGLGRLRVGQPHQLGANEGLTALVRQRVHQIEQRDAVFEAGQPAGWAHSTVVIQSSVTHRRGRAAACR